MRSGYMRSCQEEEKEDDGEEKEGVLTQEEASTQVHKGSNYSKELGFMLLKSLETTKLRNTVI